MFTITLPLWNHSFCRCNQYLHMMFQWQGHFILPNRTGPDHCRNSPYSYNTSVSIPQTRTLCCYLLPAGPDCTSAGLAGRGARVGGVPWVADVAPADAGRRAEAALLLQEEQPVQDQALLTGIPRLPVEQQQSRAFCHRVRCNEEVYVEKQHAWCATNTIPLSVLVNIAMWGRSRDIK